MLFQTFWNGAPFTPYEFMCLRSFTTNGHEIDLYTYEPRKIPQLPSVNVKDAGSVLHRREYSEQISPFPGNPGIFADHFRYALLYERGGWWVDTDVLLIGPIRKNEGAPYFALQNDGRFNNAVLYFDPQSPAMAHCMKYAKFIRSRPDVEWGETGPSLLSESIFMCGIGHLGALEEDCYAIGYGDVHSFLDPDMRELVKDKVRNSTFVHLWNAHLNEIVDKQDEPVPGSWMRERADLLLGEWDRWNEAAAQ